MLRTLLNDLKRDVASAASELGIAEWDLQRMLSGTEPIPAHLIERAVSCWPVNERDFYPLHDDCPDGVLIMRRSASESSSRTLQRGGRDYYEYRDTAMSRVTTFRPEWIRMLHVVKGQDPNEPGVEWNNGHLLYQFTYFVGTVNYYYSWAGRRHCVATNTGDSVWGVPFAPHSFAAREPGGNSHILALTYGAALVGEAQQELAALGVQTARRYCLPTTDEQSARAALLRLHLANAGLTPTALHRLTQIPVERLAALLCGGDCPDGAELDRLAAGLRVPVATLLPVISDTADGVSLLRAHDVVRWDYPSDADPVYRIGRLAGSRLHPFTKGIEIDVLAGPDGRDDVPLETALHQYIYCLGPAPVRLSWTSGSASFSESLQAGDSLYVKPFIPLRFSREASGEEARLLALRIAGRIRLDAAAELGAMPPDGLSRVVTEDRQWYDPRGHVTAGTNA